MISTNDLKNGTCIEFKDGIYQIVDFQHVKPGKGSAFVRTKLKNIETGRVIENTFNSGIKVKDVRIEYRSYQYLYHDGIGYTFMHNETYEQITLNESLIENADLMKPGQELQIMFNAEKEKPISAILPPFVELKVTYTEPGVKGDTATNSIKRATLESGAEINVPLFINIGDMIKVDTRTREYSERIN
ncbi:MAG: elongation factor P [Bacteroidales bacterium]